MTNEFISSCEPNEANVVKRFCCSTPRILSTGIFLLAGCSGGPAAVPLPDFEPDDAAERAMELYDADRDGFLAGSELDAVPGLKAAIKNLDTDQDSQVSAEEIAERIRTWQTMQIGLMSISCDVYLDGQPLEGATVTFEPEAFLGDSIKTAVGTTGMGGSFRPKIPKADRPSPDSPPGLQAGFYKVKVSKQQAGKETIPARYNVETTLGQQVSRDDLAIVNKRVLFRLKSK